MNDVQINRIAKFLLFPISSWLYKIELYFESNLKSYWTYVIIRLVYIVCLHSFIRLSVCTMHTPHVSSRISEDGRTCLSRHNRWAARGGYSVFHNKLWSETEQSPNWCKPRWRGRSSNPYCHCTLVARHMVDIDSNHRMLAFQNCSASRSLLSLP
jgi:hypothetical protein